MEQTNREKIGRYIVIACALLLLGGGVFARFASKVSDKMLDRGDVAINFLILTSPPMCLSYNSKTGKITRGNPKLKYKNANIKDLIKRTDICGENLFVAKPFSEKRDVFWRRFQDNLGNWRTRPYIIFSYLYYYIALRASGRLFLPFADFAFVSFKLQSMKPEGKILKSKTPKRAPRPAAPPPAGNSPPPIIIEILNASGRNGLASQTTRYLRKSNNEENLNLDVINYYTALNIEPHSKITAFSGRYEDLQNIAKFLGIDPQNITEQERKTELIDARIFLGADFKLPALR
jgi:hypothetical protein